MSAFFISQGKLKLFKVKYPWSKWAEQDSHWQGHVPAFHQQSKVKDINVEYRSRRVEQDSWEHSRSSVINQGRSKTVRSSIISQGELSRTIRDIQGQCLLVISQGRSRTFTVKYPWSRWAEQDSHRQGHVSERHWWRKVKDIKVKYHRSRWAGQLGTFNVKCLLVISQGRSKTLRSCIISQGGSSRTARDIQGCHQSRPKTLIIIMYIYYALINTLSTHMIHINLNIFYTHVKHSSTNNKKSTIQKEPSHTQKKIVAKMVQPMIDMARRPTLTIT